MNLATKGALAAMTLVLDLAAGNALETLWNAEWIADSKRPVQVTEPVAAMAELQRTDFGKPQTGGGVCRPTERSVMVMELDQTSTGPKALPRHVCIRAMTGEPAPTAKLGLPHAFNFKK